MGLPRSTYYDAPAIEADEAQIVARIAAICDEFETDWSAPSGVDR